LIVGGGFGGISAARLLDRLLARGLEARVTLVNRSNYFLFTPLLAEVAASLVEPRHVVTPIRRLLRRVAFVQGEVASIDTAARTALVRDGNGRETTLAWRHALLAPGSVTGYFGIEGMERNALTLKTLGDAVHVRNHVIELLERAALLDEAERRPLLTFAVVGGGLNGTEVAGELHDFVLKALDDYPAIRRSEIRMVLADLQPRLAREMPASLGDYARSHLESRGMEIWLETQVTALRDGRLETRDGRTLETATVIWTAGVRPSPLIEAIAADLTRGRVEKQPPDVPPAVKRDGRLPVNRFLQVEGFESLWAIGDSALIPDPGGGFQPPTAQHAVRQGRLAARNIAAALQGRPLEPHGYKGIGLLATLGRYRGVGQVFGVKLTGFPAWFAWRSYYLWTLPRWDRRLRVATDWTLDLFLAPDIVELNLRPLEAGASTHEAPPAGRRAGEERSQ